MIALSPTKIPQALASERNLICAVLEEPSLMAKAIEAGISRDSFTDMTCRHFFGAMSTLHAEGKLFDLLQDELTRRSPWNADAFDLLNAAADGPWRAGFAGYLEYVVAAQQRRNIISTLHRGIEAAENGQEVPHILSGLDSALQVFRAGTGAASDAAPQPPEAPGDDSPMFHGLAGEIVRTIRPHTESADTALLLHALIMFGNLIGRGPHFVVDGANHAMNLFGVCVGSTSKGRKGTAASQIKRLFKSVDEAWLKDCVKSGCSSGEGLIFAVRDEITREVQIKKGGKFTGETQTEIVDAGVEDKRLLALEPEFGKVLKVAGRDGSTLSAQIRLAWDSGNLNVLTKSPLKSTDAHISMIGHGTSEEIAIELSTSDAANGFGNRFLWLWVERSKLLPRGGNLTDADLDPLRAAIGQAVTHAGGVTELGMSDRAWELWDSQYAILSAGHDGRWGSMTSRAEAQVRRLACVYALLDCRDVVDVPHLRAALALWQYCDETACYLFGRMDEGEKVDSARDELIDLIKSHESHGIQHAITVRELARGPAKYRPPGIAEAALQSLVNDGTGRWLPLDPVGRGQPVTLFVLGGCDAATVTEIAKIKEKVNSVTVAAVTGPENIPLTHADDQPPVDAAYADAMAAEQAQTVETDV